MTQAAVGADSLLFEPFEAGRLSLSGHLARAPMWTGTADELGLVTERTLEHYGALAGQGLGLITTGFAFVSPYSRAVPRMLGVSGDEFIPGLKSLADAVQRKGDKICLQIAHCGLNSDPAFDPDGLIYGPSLIPLGGVTQIEKNGKLSRKNAQIMRSLGRKQIEEIIASFAAAAVRAEKAGFDAVELHGAHHYLISQFLSPYYNNRTDRYGGGPRNRARLAVEVVQAVRRAAPGLPVVFRLNCEDFTPGGITLEDSKLTARLLAEAGCDMVSVSGNNPLRTRIIGFEKEGYFQEQARLIRAACSLPTIVAGGVRTPKAAEEILKTGSADLVAIGRPLIRNPDLPGRWRTGNYQPYECISCNACMGAAAQDYARCLRLEKSDQNT